VDEATVPVENGLHSADVRMMHAANGRNSASRRRVAAVKDGPPRVVDSLLREVVVIGLSVEDLRTVSLAARALAVLRREPDRVPHSATSRSLPRAKAAANAHFAADLPPVGNRVARVSDDLRPVADRVQRLAASRSSARVRIAESAGNVRVAVPSVSIAVGHREKEHPSARHSAASATTVHRHGVRAAKAGSAAGVVPDDQPPAIGLARSRVVSARTAGQVSIGRFGNGKTLVPRNSWIAQRNDLPES
jgi:hypothetical protein